MTYDPRLFVLGYDQSSSYQKVIPTMAWSVSSADLIARRDLFFRVDTLPNGVVNLLLSGDAQDGSDVLKLSGDVADNLRLSAIERFQIGSGDIGLIKGQIFGIDLATFNWSGSDVEAFRDLIHRTEPGTYGIGVTGTGLRRDLYLRTLSATFAVTGYAAVLTDGSLFPIDLATYSIGTGAIKTLRDLIARLSSGSFSCVPNEVGLIRSLLFDLDPGSIAIVPQTVAFRRDLIMRTVAETWSFAAADTDPVRSLLADIEVGNYALTADSIELKRSLVISAGAGAWSIAGIDVPLAVTTGSDGILLSGDEQSGGDRLLLSGTAQSGGDLLSRSSSS